jgi:hypothetical protein
LGGVIVATLGAAVAFVINAFSSFAMIAALLSWRPQRPEKRLPLD